jgi:DNA-binding GntR family transcriptional regulator
VDSIQGRGTYVRSAKPEKVPVFNNDFVGSVIRGMPAFERILLKCEKISPPEYIIKLLKIESGEKCLLAERLDSFEGTPFSYDRSYIPEKFTNSINTEILKKLDFFNIWLEREAIEISSKNESTEAVKADNLAVERLKCEPESPVLLTTETMYDNDNKPVSVFESYYRGDLIRLVSRK